MPTVSKAARVTARAGAVWRTCGGCGILAPLSPDVDRCGDCVQADQLRGLADHFDHNDLADVSFAGGVFAAAIAEVAHHEIGDPGSWDCYGTVPEEMDRLRRALTRMQDAITRTRAGLAAIEQRARHRAQAAGRGRSA
jgi:hypothetical protein